MLGTVDWSTNGLTRLMAPIAEAIFFHSKLINEGLIPR